MKPTEVLMQEHELIKQMLTVINKICDKLQAGEKVDGSHLEQIVDFIRNFADKCHHGKEEDILFDSMVEAGFSKEAGPIGVMLSEHDLGRDFVSGLSEAIEGYNKGDMNAISAIVANAQRYSTLLDQHIDKENNVLFPMADARLTQEQQNKMVKDFDKFEEQEMGTEIHEKYHRILNDLKTLYLQ